ncbi:MAG: ADP-ribosylglycohydrolase family protein [Deltaproteobacteria bacterium]|jgi:ADP-ribosylglycohydrolase|nr:ADP-ribosylglycohydrolase family protein [Deltaproteobacteria bacterium]
MIGAIIGDIVGSRFEFDNVKTKQFKFFHEKCRVTDDTILTLAAADAVMTTDSKHGQLRDENRDRYLTTLFEAVVSSFRLFASKYPDAGYGDMFKKWLSSDNPLPYGSFGNGAAMRISPVAHVAANREDLRHLVNCVTFVTHTHREAARGAMATAEAVFLALRQPFKRKIKRAIEKKYYSLDFGIDDIRETYRRDFSCRGTVPQAIRCFLESSSLEDAIRLAVSLGGDSDTLASVAGAIAGAFHGVPKDMRETALGYLDDFLRSVFEKWDSLHPVPHERFRPLTRYMEKLKNTSEYYEPHPYHNGFVFVKVIEDLARQLRLFEDNNPSYDLANFKEINRNSPLVYEGSGNNPDIMKLSAAQVLAFMKGIFRVKPISDDLLLSFFKCGALDACLERLKMIDLENA